MTPTDAPILVLFGTQTGNAELLADDLADALAEAGHIARVVDMADAYPELLEEHALLIAVLCTWSEGTFPDNAVEFHETLASVAPDLAHLRYGVVGLGDHLYDPFFLTAAYRLQETLDGLGADRIAPPFEIDKGPSDGDVERARAWALRCVDLATA